MEELNFYDLKEKKSVESDDYKIKIKKGRRFAVHQMKDGRELWRIIGKNF